ncbi:FHA domain protein [Rosistilla carotiformis]|uniref:FHA domain protein n=1 Tax=Rosistilla carotiformis TaxID=2528017 RepID=A0A518JRG6_9BACT|nr:FHA domain-containing protein [Rosistilla carotiformis]QDV68116.1 FHA domain protein [Rosistilla carotiformis]
MNDDVPPPTQLESDEEVQRVQAELRHQAQGSGKKRSSDDEKLFRPTARPPVVMLVVCDDGKDSGELIRIRSDRFTIGRTEGDLQISHDEMISSRHVALHRQSVAGQVRLCATDLQSRNGLFVRVTKAPLMHQAEVLIGGGHYKMDIVRDDVPETVALAGPEELLPASTKALEGQHVPGAVILSEIIAGRAETRTMLDRSRYVIGRGEHCEIQRPRDPYTRTVHAVLSRSERGTWVIEGANTINGIWLRVPQIVVNVGKSCEFRIGEQRFRLKFGSRS